MPINTSIPGQLRPEEMKSIELLASLVPANGHIVEVGSLLGLSSWIWAKSAASTVTVHCIDPWELAGGGNFDRLAKQNRQVFTKAQFLTNVKDCSNIVAHQGFSPNNFEDWTIPVDLFFDDAVHNDPILAQNLDFWSAKLTANGIICGHDFVEKFPDVRAGAARLAERHNRRLQVIGSFWVLLPPAVINSTDPKTQAVLQELNKLEEEFQPKSLFLSDEIKLAVEKSKTMPSFSYEISARSGPGGVKAVAGGMVIIAGAVKNVSGHDWPGKLTEECYLEVGVELFLAEKKVSVGRFAVPGNVVKAGETVNFEVALPVAAAGVGYCKVDLLYRHAFWFGARGASPVRVPVEISAKPAQASAA